MKMFKKVLIKTKDKEELWGHLFIEEGKRTQDILNDARQFLPFYKERHGKPTVDSGRPTDAIMISKDYILLVEEVD